jgi:hypothetical protein
MSAWERDYESDRPFKPTPARRRAKLVFVAALVLGALATLVALAVFLAALVRLFKLVAGV